MSLLDKLNANFFVAAFIPSLAFVFISIVIFDPIIPDAVKIRIPFSFTSPEETSSEAILLFTLSLTLVIGFTLSSLNTFIYKFTEGYYILGRIPFWRNRHYIKAKHHHDRIKKLELVLKRLKAKKAPEKITTELEEKLFNLKTLYQLEYPPDYRYALPTRFGNIFRSAESYSADRYGLESIVIWPRLIYAIAPSYFSKLEQSNNGLAFLVNCMILAFFLALSCLAAAVYQFVLRQLQGAELVELFYFVPIDQAASVYMQRFFLYLLGMGLFSGVAILFYHAALPAAQQYGGLIRSAFDLFRFQLLEQLRLQLPEDSDDEYQTWYLWNEFVAVGRSRQPMLPIKYRHPAGNKESDQPNPSGSS